MQKKRAKRMLVTNYILTHKPQIIMSITKENK